MHRTALAFAAGLAILSFSFAAPAQNISADPLYGTLNLSGGFTPDPASVQIQAGGADSANNLGPNCTGYINNAAPDVRLNFQAGQLPLYIYVESQSDTTLAVNLPNGQWVCNDDSQGLNPAVTVQPAMSGQYDIWVGTYQQTGAQPATLYVSEVSAHQQPGGGTPPGGSASGTPGGSAGGGPNLMADPLYGTLNLSGGFTPDPATVQVQAGGSSSADGLGPNCTGFINNAAPDVRLNFQAGQLPLHIYAESQADTTLVVNLPNGQWRCNDDSLGLNPGLTVQPAMSGQYDIWIGTYDQSGTPPATLYVSEVSGHQQPGGNSGTAPGGTPGGTPGGSAGSGPNVMADPLYGTLNLSGGFTPDPATVQVQAGGSSSANGLGPNCTGFINNAAPDVRLNFQAGQLPLYIYAQSQADTTLVVNLPNGQWRCNDDSQGLNPGLTIQPAMSGQYDIWIGTYDQSGTPPATLYVSEVSGG